MYQPPKDSEKRRKSDKAKEKGNSTKDNSDDDDDLKVYASMAQMSNDDVSEKKRLRRYFAIDQLDFGFRSNMPYDAGSYGLHSRIIRGYG